ncbi:glycosyltransferase [Methylobacterium nodulans]|uniref:Glycosyl transferase family 2 n=1 Tax=Methylobacterium nodulans (strain LMG 21967 / CNCM I-2342 / ORS 2060) TaxID=460265 RepID=B8IGJ2_METNO|nr:glycosyltransferase [Methylobacterium nodulans]ACL55892.1 glycosyl transferase family 2 [Methylobacterium nodulans ORS 2060]
MSTEYPDNEISLSVLICTRNRARSLERTLASLVRAKKPEGLAWEIVVVDNNSNDETQSVVQSFVSSLPLRSVVESQPGLSHARNRGVLAARGRNLVWTDDDVEVDGNWLCSYADAFRNHPGMSLFGGGSVAVLEEPAIGWFRANTTVLRDLLAVRNFGPDPVPISLARGAVPFGLNYGVRAEVQRRFLYDPELGVAPDRRIGGEEVDFYERVLKAGYAGLCLPDPIVYHHIPLARQTLDYVLSYYDSAGVTSAVLLFRHRQPTTREYSSIRLKCVVAGALTMATWPIPRALRLRTMIRNAFHSGRFRRLRQMHQPLARPVTPFAGEAVSKN